MNFQISDIYNIIVITGFAKMKKIKLWFKAKRFLLLIIITNSI